MIIRVDVKVASDDEFMRCGIEMCVGMGFPMGPGIPLGQHGAQTRDVHGMGFPMGPGIPREWK